MLDLKTHQPDALVARVRAVLPVVALLLALAFAVNVAPPTVLRADDATTDAPADPDKGLESAAPEIRELLGLEYARGGRTLLGMDLYLPPGPPIELDRGEDDTRSDDAGQGGGEGGDSENPKGTEESGEADGDGTSSDDAEATDGPYPAIIFVHGGSWVGGTRDQGTEMCRHFANNGYVAATITYRLLTNGGNFPNPVHDCKAAIRHLKRYAELYRIDVDRIALIGASAGAHLALMAALTTPACADGYCEGDDLGSALDPVDTALEVDTCVAAVVAIAPPTDFRLEAGAEGSIMQELLVRAFVSDGDLARASPITYVSEDDPPTLLFHCERDSVVPYDQSVRLHKALDEARVVNEFVRLDLDSHVPGGKERERIVQYTQSFLDHHLLGKPHNHEELGNALEMPLLPPPPDPNDPAFEEDF